MGITYEPQKPIGRYIVDIYIPGCSLVIECDGDYWHSLPESQKRDRRKDAWLRRHGYQVVRLPEHEIKANPQEALKTRAGLLF